MQRQRRAVGLQTASGPVSHSAPVFARRRKEFWRSKITILNLADDAKDGAVGECLTAQGRRHLHEESRAVSNRERRSSA
jgi:hypothetical protein